MAVRPVSESVGIIESALADLKYTLKADSPHPGVENQIAIALEPVADAVQGAARRAKLVYEDEKKTVARQKAREAEEKKAAAKA